MASFIAMLLDSVYQTPDFIIMTALHNQTETLLDHSLTHNISCTLDVIKAHIGEE